MDSVNAYLAALPPERRKVMAAVRKLIRKNLPKGYDETFNWGMIAYEIPLSRYPKTYNKKPLMFLALAAQKNAYSLYLMCAYGDSEKESALKEAYAKSGKKLDMGKSCLRFKSLADLEIEAIGELIASTPVEDFIACYEASRPRK